jgi:hypothetical protein
MNIESDSDEPKKRKGPGRGKKGTKMNSTVPKPIIKNEEQIQKT